MSRIPDHNITFRSEVNVGSASLSKLIQKLQKCLVDYNIKRSIVQRPISDYGYNKCSLSIAEIKIIINTKNNIINHFNEPIIRYKHRLCNTFSCYKT